MALAITRTEFSARELRATAAKVKDAKAARRMLAIALVMGLKCSPLDIWIVNNQQSTEIETS